MTGPGHGAAANLANHYLDGSLEEFYPDMTRDAAGVERFVRSFSWPGGFPSHLTPGTPGTIHEGGELGYALATSFGAAMDNPDLLVACIVGDGEAETGPTAGSWNSNRFLDPRTGGAVLPILDVNGYKISSATIAGTMSDDELLMLYRGLGWTPLVVSGDDDGVDARMAAALDEAWELIGRIQGQARSGTTELKPAWPMIVLRTPKGWTGPKEIDGKKVEGSFRAHQVPAGDLKTNPDHLAIVEAWLRSYKPEELFEIDGSPASDIQEFVPKGDLRLGMVDDSIGGRVRRPMDLPDASIVAVPVDRPGATDAGALDQVGAYLREVMRRTEEDRNFRIFCPDELEFEQARGGARGDRARAPVVRRGRQPLHAGRAGRRGPRRAPLRGLPRGLPQDRPARPVPVLRGVHPDRRLADRAVRQVAQGVQRDPVAAAPRVAQHPAHVGRMAPGPQRLFAPEPGLHQQPAHQEGHGPADHAAARREHAQRDRRALPALHRLHQPGHRHEAAAAAVAVDGRGQGPCRRGRLDLALGVERRRASTPTS